MYTYNIYMHISVYPYNIYIYIYMYTQEYIVTMHLQPFL